MTLQAFTWRTEEAIVPFLLIPNCAIRWLIDVHDLAGSRDDLLGLHDWSARAVSATRALCEIQQGSRLKFNSGHSLNEFKSVIAKKQWTSLPPVFSLWFSSKKHPDQERPKNKCISNSCALQLNYVTQLTPNWEANGNEKSKKGHFAASQRQHTDMYRV